MIKKKTKQEKQRGIAIASLIKNYLKAMDPNKHYLII